MISGSGRSSGERNGNPLHYSCLENSMDRGAWGATVHSYTELDRTEKLTLNRKDRMARAGEAIRTYGLGSQVIRN